LIIVQQQQDTSHKSQDSPISKRNNNEICYSTSANNLKSNEFYNENEQNKYNSNLSLNEELDINNYDCEYENFFSI
jgi:hypothetical protein